MNSTYTIILTSCQRCLNTCIASVSMSRFIHDDVTLIAYSSHESSKTPSNT